MRTCDLDLWFARILTWLKSLFFLYSLEGRNWGDVSSTLSSEMLQFCPTVCLVYLDHNIKLTYDCTSTATIKKQAESLFLWQWVRFFSLLCSSNMNFPLKKLVFSGCVQLKPSLLFDLCHCYHLDHHIDRMWNHFLCCWQIKRVELHCEQMSGHVKIKHFGVVITKLY